MPRREADGHFPGFGVMDPTPHLHWYTPAGVTCTKILYRNLLQMPIAGHNQDVTPGTEQILATRDADGETHMTPDAVDRTDLAVKLERLFERHRLDFLGPLAAVVSSRGQLWEKGFLVECRATLDGPNHFGDP